MAGGALLFGPAGGDVLAFTEAASEPEPERSRERENEPGRSTAGERVDCSTRAAALVASRIGELPIAGAAPPIDGATSATFAATSAASCSTAVSGGGRSSLIAASSGAPAALVLLQISPLVRRACSD